MAAKLEQLSALKHQLSVTVSADDVKKRYDKKASNVAAKANIKGFRPGKVPLSVVEKRFGHGLLYEAAAESVDATFKSEMDEQKIKMAGLPKIDFDMDKLKLGESFVYTATFEVFPEIQLKDLTDAEIESVSGEVTDEDVSSMLVRMRTQHAEWEIVDRAAKLGDRITIDFDGEMDGKPMEGGSAKGQKLELGSHSMIPGFEDGLITAKKSDTKTLNLIFPAEYHVESLRGKPAIFTVTVHEVQEPKLPALDDAYAKKMGATDGVDALKKQVKEKMQKELNDTAHAITKKNALDKLMSFNPIEIPESLIDAEIANLQEGARQQLNHLTKKKISDEDWKKLPISREPFLEEAKKRVTLGLLLAEVIKLQKIEVDQNTVAERLKDMAAQYGDVNQFLPLLQENKRVVSDIEAYVLEERAIDLLLSKARVLAVKKSYDAIVNAKQ